MNCRPSVIKKDTKGNKTHGYSFQRTRAHRLCDEFDAAALRIKWILPFSSSLKKEKGTALKCSFTKSHCLAIHFEFLSLSHSLFFTLSLTNIDTHQQLHHSRSRISLLPLFMVNGIPFQSCFFSAATTNTNTNTFEFLFVLLIIFQSPSHCDSNYRDKNNQKPIVFSLHINAYTPMDYFFRNYWRNDVSPKRECLWSLSLVER